MTASSTPHRVFAGTSGWSYASWKPGFYPAKTPAAKFLQHYAARLNSVEVNYTFRQLPALSTVQGWLAQVDGDFRFTFKAPQRITHMRRLKDCSSALLELAQALQPAVDCGRMGLVLFQLPPNFKADPGRLENFLETARTEAPELSRLAFEFRHPSWFQEETFKLLERHSAALCVAESEELATPDVATAPYSCYRLRRSGYSEADLDEAAVRLRQNALRGEVFAYFKHEEAPDGALHAERLLQRLRAS